MFIHKSGDLEPPNNFFVLPVPDSNKHKFQYIFDTKKMKMANFLAILIYRNIGRAKLIKDQDLMSNDFSARILLGVRTFKIAK